MPPGTLIMDLAGKSVIPGLVMVHEHLHYPTGPGVSGNLTQSFSRLYLAGGVTSMRTASNMNGIGEIKLKQAIDAGAQAGPWIDATAPYLEGRPGIGLGQVYEIEDAADARRQIAYWTSLGATSLKAYLHLTRAELRAVVDEGHRRGMKVTGHLCSVTYREAADLGIDNLEHGLFAATDFVAGKRPDVCPGTGLEALAALDADAPAVKSLIRYLVDKQVALTSTLTVLGDLCARSAAPAGPRGARPAAPRPVPPNQGGHRSRHRIDLRGALPEAGEVGRRLLPGRRAAAGRHGPERRRRRDRGLLGSARARAAGRGGTHSARSDPGRHRERRRVPRRGALVGSIAAGKQADLVVIDGDPSAHIEDVRKVSLVFKQGVGYDPAKLIASVKGRVGLF